MGTGNSGRYSGTRGSQTFPGSSDYMKPGDPFSKNIKNRKDIDVNGFHDVVAHGSPNNIMIEHNGQQVEVDHRVLSRLLANDKSTSNKAIRLLSCNTGKVDAGFAQNLANKLNRPVKAPTEYLWARPDGSYFVAEGKRIKGRLIPDMSKPGKFKTYHPKRRK
ncbi:MAG: hypothetical protein IIW54_03060 [Lachnospiraceae bacterium]|nr:hypothetical protein [Lachnospiraceae bacterium]